MGAFMDEGDILGHEPMGIVEEVGAEVTHIKAGDRGVIPFNISCGHCYMCDSRGHAPAGPSPRSPRFTRILLEQDGEFGDENEILSQLEAIESAAAGRAQGSGRVGSDAVPEGPGAQPPGWSRATRSASRRQRACGCASRPPP